jgi:hypothetical protein
LQAPLAAPASRATAAAWAMTVLKFFIEDVR